MSGRRARPPKRLADYDTSSARRRSRSRSPSASGASPSLSAGVVLDDLATLMPPPHAKELPPLLPRLPAAEIVFFARAWKTASFLGSALVYSTTAPETRPQPGQPASPPRRYFTASLKPGYVWCCRRISPLGFDGRPRGDIVVAAAAVPITEAQSGNQPALPRFLFFHRSRPSRRYTSSVASIRPPTSRTERFLSCFVSRQRTNTARPRLGFTRPTFRSATHHCCILLDRTSNLFVLACLLLPPTVFSMASTLPFFRA